MQLDLRYGLCSSSDRLVAIVDYEALETLERHSLIGEKVRRLNLASSNKHLTRKVTKICRSFSIIDKIREDNPKFLPLRWGFNSLAIKVSNPDLANQIFSDFQDNPIDLYDFFTSVDHPLRRILLENNQNCPLLALDWHLPVMMLLIQSACGKTAWHSPNTSKHSTRVQTLMEAVYLWLSETIMHTKAYGTSPLIDDVMQMQSVLKNLDLCIVLGGGNFLWSPSNQLSPDNVLCLPVLVDNNGYCLLWCEVLALLAQEEIQIRGGPEFDKLMTDSRKLLNKIVNSLDWTNSHSTFHGYTQVGKLTYSHYDQKRLSEREEWWHNFAKDKGELRYSNAPSVEQWINEWSKTRDRLKAVKQPEPER
jgi:hypothetical protein